MTTPSGESPWITGPEARDYVHEMRAAHDAIMVGSGTALADDPLLTCRIPGLEKQSPIRIILDGRLRLMPTLQLVTTARDVPTWVITKSDSDNVKRAHLEREGVLIYDAPAHVKGELALKDVFHFLATQGITTVMIEGGERLAASVLRAHFADRIVWLEGPRHVGGDAVNIVETLGLEELAKGPLFHLTETRSLGPDELKIFKKTH